MKIRMGFTACKTKYNIQINLGVQREGVDRIRQGDYKDQKRNLLKAIIKLLVPRKTKDLLADRKLAFEEKLYAMSYLYCFYFVNCWSAVGIATGYGLDD
jgi:hypothetical protein